MQQGFGIDFLKSFSNCYHLLVSMKEVFPDNFPENFWYANFFDFQGLLHSAVSRTGAIS